MVVNGVKHLQRARKQWNSSISKKNCLGWLEPITGKWIFKWENDS